jgi:potassium uptake system protein
VIFLSKKQFVVIGLGRFGSSIATTLYSLGNDVLVIDKNEDLIQDIASEVTHAVQADATDENALRALGIRNFDVAIISIGGDIQSSVMATLILRELGVKYIIAKGNGELHAKVLYKIGADRVVLPEKDMGVRVAHNIISSSILDYIELSSDYSIMEVKAFEDWVGKDLKSLNLRKKYGINVIAIKKGEKINLNPAADDKVCKDNVIVAIGSKEALTSLEGEIIKD